MRLAVVGAGVVGTTTAFELTLDGHEVTVFERRSTVAEEASFATGAIVAAGWTAPWSPTERSLRMSWTSRSGGMRLHRLPRGGEWRWLWHWLQAGRHERQTESHRQMHQLVRYNQERLLSITEDHALDHDRSEGMLVLWRDPREAEQARPALQQMKELGIGFRELSAEQARALEPALNPETPLHGAIELTGEAVANCREFVLSIRTRAQQLGCRFEFNTRVESIKPCGSTAVDLRLASTSAPASRRTPHVPAETERFDAVIVCAGAHSAPLLHSLGLRAPLQNVQSHSISAALREPLDAPLSAVFDTRHGVSIARLGQRIRVAGGCDFGHRPGRLSRSTLRRLYGALNDWFPGAVRLGGPHGSVQEWQGAQATVPDGLPLLGTTRVPGVWLNLGHGRAGWSMACGSARAVADQLAGRDTDMELSGCSPRRYDL
ncbi:FAD-dependent oxidoreductase [Hydrogenophaga sp.]|uniref:FAD-dependent oxidoreductase n=1 Tax=Hydrogenophaga sp. TaxID=1904254 RepID=UPI003D0DA69E